MEGLIPFVVRALKKNRLLHQHSYRSSFSDGSRRSYHLLSAGGDSVHGHGSGSSHRRAHSEFIEQRFYSEDLDQETDNTIARSRSCNRDSVRANRTALEGANQSKFHKYERGNPKKLV